MNVDICRSSLENSKRILAVIRSEPFGFLGFSFHIILTIWKIVSGFIGSSN